MGDGVGGWFELFGVFNSVGVLISFVDVCVGFVWYGFVLITCWL